MKSYLMDLRVKLSADAAKAHKSLTIWFNSIMAAAVVALPMLQDQLPQLQGYLPANLYHSAMATLIVGNIILRFKTNGALADK